MGISCERRIGHDRLAGMWAYQQVGELYRALRLYINCFQPSMKLLEKRREGGRVRRMYDPAKTPLQRLLLSGVLPADKQQALQTMADALNPVRLFEQLTQLQQAVFQCTMSAAPFLSPAVSPTIVQFALEDGTCIASQASAEATPHPEAVLQTLRQQQQRRHHLLDWKRTRHDPFAGEWEQILAWMQANPERTGAEIFRALQRRSPGRYRPTHLRTLQRGMLLIRTRLLEMEEVSWPNEVLPADVSVDPLVPRREEECEPFFGALPTASLCPLLPQEPIEAEPTLCSLPPE